MGTGRRADLEARCGDGHKARLATSKTCTPEACDNEADIKSEAAKANHPLSLAIRWYGRLATKETIATERVIRPSRMPLALATYPTTKIPQTNPTSTTRLQAARQ